MIFEPYHEITGGSLEPKWRRALRSLIVLKLRELGPMNNNQIADACRLHVSNIAPRMSELVSELKVRDTGRRHSSVSGKGRKLVVWEAIEAGRFATVQMPLGEPIRYVNGVRQP